MEWTMKEHERPIIYTGLIVILVCIVIIVLELLQFV
jgi:hypothetical protein